MDQFPSDARSTQAGQSVYDENKFAGDMEPEIDVSTSPVATTATKNAIIYIILGVVVIYAIYFSFFKQTTQEIETAAINKLESIENVQVEQPPAPTIPVLTPSVPQLPEPPVLTPPAPPTQMIELTPPPTIESVEVEANAPEAPVISSILEEGTPTGAVAKSLTKEQRRKSGIMQSGGGGGASTGIGIGAAGAPTTPAGATAAKSHDPYFTMEHTSADQSKATSMGNTQYLVAQGKIIDIVLETGINTDIPGPLRAIVSRDVFSESGRKILIPKGSRVIGNYGTTSPKRGQTRIAISWTRIMRPDGVDVAISSAGVDALGRSGSEGFVDNRYLELFGNAILLSVVNIAVASAADKLAGTSSSGANTTSTNATTGTTTSSSTADATTQAIQDSVSQIGEVAKGVAQDYLAVSPTITIDQGTKMKIFVQQDLVFPENFDLNGKVVQ